jgi:hypothetical protein
MHRRNAQPILARAAEALRGVSTPAPGVRTPARATSCSCRRSHVLTLKSVPRHVQLRDPGIPAAASTANLLPTGAIHGASGRNELPTVLVLHASNMCTQLITPHSSCIDDSDTLGRNILEFTLFVVPTGHWLHVPSICPHLAVPAELCSCCKACSASVDAETIVTSGY